MKKPSLGWQSWSPPYPRWHGLPRWDYPPKIKSIVPMPKIKPKTLKPIRYWCSWYAYGWDINHAKITSTITVIKKFNLPFTHILIDDGWTTWGDWHVPNQARFSNIKKTIKEIKSHHMQAGLWFAPFLANKNSRLFKEHPAWFVKYKGHPIQGLKTIPVWESIIPQQYLLNLELPEVKDYIAKFIDLVVCKWGVSMLKLDFLYAPYFDPNQKTDLAPYNHIKWIFKYIKTKYPKVITIACGAPFAPSIGDADIIRISKDTALPPSIPSFFNRLFYRHRVKMLLHKVLSPEIPLNINSDPDVRIVSFDNNVSETMWGKISPNIKGIGDELTSLSVQNLNKIKLWLSK